MMATLRRFETFLYLLLSRCSKGTRISLPEDHSRFVVCGLRDMGIIMCFAYYNNGTISVLDHSRYSLPQMFNSSDILIKDTLPISNNFFHIFELPIARFSCSGFSVYNVLLSLSIVTLGHDALACWTCLWLLSISASVLFASLIFCIIVFKAKQ